ncbi:MAG: hypothetical protein HY067_06670 [Betaproteobacteria bacterium]|nr:hypothetical protein [Betaproteobacteria bacterium]
MRFQSSGESSIVHELALRDVGIGEVVANLRKDWLVPASERLRDLTSRRVRLAIFKMASRNANWDGYGSAAHNENSIASAVEAIEELFDQTKIANFGWVDPHVGLNERGDVVFEWWNYHKKLTLYFSPETIEYVSSWGSNIETQMEAGVLEKDGFADLWRWLRLQID